jgi:hypothetical protein
VKSLTREQLQSRKDKAVQFVRDLKGDPERAAEIEDECLEDYAERRKIQLINTGRARSMANGRTKEDLPNEIDDLRAENQDLQDQLDAIADIVSPEPEEADDDEDGDGSDADD